MCAEGKVCIAIFALAMIFTLPGAQRRQKLTIWLSSSVGSIQDMRCAPAMRGGTRIQSMKHEPCDFFQRRVGRRSCLIVSE